MWPVANVAFGMAAPEKTIHYCGEFREGRKARVFRKQKERGVGKQICKTMRREGAEIEKRAAEKGSGRIVSGGGIAYRAAGTIGARGDRVEIGAQARLSNRVQRGAG